MRHTVQCRNASEAAQMLRAGQLVAFPTETVYGLGADAKNCHAVAGIFESKQRPSFDPLIVHVASVAHAASLVTQFPEAAQLLAERFWPGPLTLVLPKTNDIPDLVTSGLPGVGIRIPAHPLALEILTAAGCPVAAPSANPFSGISPTTAQHVLDGLDGRIDGILDGGPCGVGVESTVVSLMDAHPTLLRPGGLPVEDIESVIGPLQRPAPVSADEQPQPAPGMLTRHYAPKTPLVLVAATAELPDFPEKRCGLLTWGSMDLADTGRFDYVEQLSSSGDLRTCAAGFFGALRRLDSTAPDMIIARRFPETGLGVALNDRLLRASAK
ncbi:MAG: L-threonylcarbamoyladenylate synthase [Planctomycetaceae bacterium]